MAAVRQVLDSGDIAQIHTASEALNAAVTKIGEAMYQEAEASSTPSTDGETPSSGEEEEGKPEDTVEGEYREV